MKRQRGFYWVIWGNEWEICEWTGIEWLLSGFSRDSSYDDGFMQEIDERKIINPNE